MRFEYLGDTKCYLPNGRSVPPVKMPRAIPTHVFVEHLLISTYPEFQNAAMHKCSYRCGVPFTIAYGYPTAGKNQGKMTVRQSLP